VRIAERIAPADPHWNSNGTRPGVELGAVFASTTSQQPAVQLLRYSRSSRNAGAQAQEKLLRCSSRRARDYADIENLVRDWATARHDHRSGSEEVRRLVCEYYGYMR